MKFVFNRTSSVRFGAKSTPWEKCTSAGVHEEEGARFPGQSQTKEYPAAEIVEVCVVQLTDPRTKEDFAVIIDPRHMQARDQLRLSQDILEGRLGGLTPVRLQIEKASALDRDGQQIPGTEIIRIGAMESPGLSRTEAKIVVDDKPIGEWSADLDAAVDRAVDFEIAQKFADYASKLKSGPETLEWKAVRHTASAKLQSFWEKEGISSDSIVRDLGRFEPSPADFFAGRHADATGLSVEHKAWDPERDPVPTGTSAQAIYFFQQAVIENFRQSMLSIPVVQSDGSVLERDIAAHVENNLLDEKQLPVKRPARSAEMRYLTVSDKAQSIATHLLVGAMRADGAQIQNGELENDLKASYRIHREVIELLDDLKVPKGEYAAHYFAAVAARSEGYRKDAGLKVEREARKVLKFPVPEAAPDRLHDHLGTVATAAGKVGRELHDAGQHLETISFF